MKPNVVALYTSPRKQGEDALWYPETVDSPLFSRLKETHHFLMRTQNNITKGEPPIAVIAAQEGVGLLIADMPTLLVDSDKRPLLDAYNRPVSNTLYLEFDATHQQRVLQAAAALLLDYEHGRYKSSIKTLFPESTEGIVCQDALDGKAVLIINDVVLPELRTEELPPKSPVDAQGSKIAAPARKYRKDYAAYLNSFPALSANPLIFVSTGSAKKDEIQQYAKRIRNETLIVLTLSGSVPDKEHLVIGQAQQAAGIFPAVPKMVKQAIQIVVLKGIQTVQNVIPKNPPTANQPKESENSKQQEESANTKIQSKPDKKPADSSKTAVTAGITMLLVLGSLFLLTRDRIPPQLVGLTLQAVNVMENADAPIPRFGKQGVLQLTFTDNKKALSPDMPPRPTLDAGAQTLSFPQPCAPADEQGKTWDCPFAVTSANPNQAETFTLTIAEVKDRAGNIMQPAKFTMTLESAEIEAYLESLTIKREHIQVAIMMIRAKAKYGVTAVEVSGVSAISVQGQANLWQAEIPVAALLQSKQPAMIVVTDKNGNTFETRL